MKIFARERMVRQYKIGAFSPEVDLRFLLHKLVLEIYEDGHFIYDEEKL